MSVRTLGSSNNSLSVDLLLPEDLGPYYEISHHPVRLTLLTVELLLPVPIFMLNQLPVGKLMVKEP